ncbi:MAG: ArnT family glycosyltransferase [Anaerolineales bacterium]
MREEAVSFWYSTGQYEPPILERLVAIVYLAAGGEYLWISRIITSIFWIIAGVALFNLARRLTEHPSRGSSLAAAAVPVIAVAYFLFLPFAVQASRSFQPDPMMVMWIVLSVNMLYRWSQEHSWKWAVLTGIFGGIAVLTKVVAFYIIGGAVAALVLYSQGVRRFWRDPQVWTILGLTLAPSAIYYLGRGGRASEFFTSWTVELSHLLLQPSFYARWLNTVQGLMGLSVLLAALAGILIARPRPRALLIGLWAGYAIYGLFLPYQMTTHNYYHLQLIPIIALSLVPLLEPVLEKIGEQRWWWQALFAGVVIMGLAFSAVVSVAEQKREDHRVETAYWQELASYLPVDGKIIALTQDYGYRLMYYGWRKVTLWPNRGELNVAKLRGSEKEFEAYFKKRVEDKSYFLITAFNQFDDQPDLQEYLEQHYPVVAQGVGYLIYDLANPL